MSKFKVGCALAGPCLCRLGLGRERGGGRAVRTLYLTPSLSSVTAGVRVGGGLMLKPSVWVCPVSLMLAGSSPVPRVTTPELVPKCF